jgi:vanillate O-demethylase ferredoxin subunit
VSHPSHRVRLRSLRWEAEDVYSCEFEPFDRLALPAFTAGAHIDLHLPGDMVRSYSLCNAPSQRGSFIVAVGLEPSSRGGSKYIHTELRPGTVIEIRGPRNHFALDPQSDHSVMVAGGIGVTPIWAMAQELASQGRSWQLFYAARNRGRAAFLADIESLAGQCGARLQLHFDDEVGKPPDLESYLAGTQAGAHAYCCGPSAMLDAFEASALRHLERDRIHVERFKAQATEAKPLGAFQVELRQSGRVLAVPAQSTLLDVLLDAGIDVPYSCMDGICGSCEVRVLDGIPDHRDSVLSSQQKAANDRAMVCCCRAKSELMVLDL